MLGNISGSPQAVIKATENLLTDKVSELKSFREKVAAAYGFGPNHRPNKRFDQMAKRNIATYFYWKCMRKSDQFWTPFELDSKGNRRTKSQASRAAIKAASWFEVRLTQYEELLRIAEEAGHIPTRFFARRLR